MTTNVQRRDYTPPPPLDEGYWAALLREGEFAEPVPIGAGTENGDADAGRCSAG